MNRFAKYRPFLLFLGKFFLAYVILAGLYRLFLSPYDGLSDPATRAVATQSEWLLQLFGADAFAEPHPTLPYERMYFNNKYVARIIEGCNAISVMVLFAAFVVAFSGKLRDTVIFIIAGCAIIHVLNVARIALLCAALFHYPEHEHFLHGVVFPLFIYSVVFALWVVWVNKFSKHATR